MLIYSTSVIKNIFFQFGSKIPLEYLKQDLIITCNFEIDNASSMFFKNLKNFDEFFRGVNAKMS